MTIQGLTGQTFPDCSLGAQHCIWYKQKNPMGGTHRAHLLVGGGVQIR